MEAAVVPELVERFLAAGVLFFALAVDALPDFAAADFEDDPLPALLFFAMTLFRWSRFQVALRFAAHTLHDPIKRLFCNRTTIVSQGCKTIQMNLIL